GIEDRGAIRSQFCHAVDIAPTLLEACGVTAPDVVDGVEQQPIDGVSLLETFANATLTSPHELQYFEMLGSRSIYRDGWKATTDRVVRGVAEEERSIEGSRALADDTWQLFDLRHDFAEASDLADEHPDVVRELDNLWWAEAGRNHVLPMGDWLD